MHFDVSADLLRGQIRDSQIARAWLWQKRRSQNARFDMVTRIHYRIQEVGERFIARVGQRSSRECRYEKNMAHVAPQIIVDAIVVHEQDLRQIPAR